MWAAGWKLSLAAVIRLKVRYFTDGVVLGSQAFVDEFFARQREFFWSAEEERREKDEGRGLDWTGGEGGLWVLRDLKANVVTPPG